MSERWGLVYIFLAIRHTLFLTICIPYFTAACIYAQRVLCSLCVFV